MSAPAESPPDARYCPTRATLRRATDRATARALWLTTCGVLGALGSAQRALAPVGGANIDADVLEPALIALRALTWLVPSVLYLRRHDPRPPLVALG